MALTTFQRSLCHLIAEQRVASGESYVAGSTALNLATGSGRVSRDIDLFHDRTEAVALSWQADRRLLESKGFTILVDREREGYVEAIVRQGENSVVMQWTADSAFRFFPLLPHDDFGLTLHPFDLATNKVLALVGRLEVRDWVDVIACHEQIQPLGYLMWAAAAKDPGFSPGAILEEAGRSARYSKEEIALLEFAGDEPDPVELSGRWRAMLREAAQLIALLPPQEAGKCLLGEDQRLFRGDPAALASALAVGQIRFHSGSLRGSLPVLRHR